jgi:hypothetical protein
VNRLAGGVMVAVAGSDRLIATPKHISPFARYVNIMQKRKHYGENNELVECWLSSDTTWDSCVLEIDQLWK